MRRKGAESITRRDPVCRKHSNFLFPVSAEQDGHALCLAMNLRTLPPRLNDGQHDYRLVSQEADAGEGKKWAALYEREPVDPDWLYTPDLAFCEGITSTPVMHRVRRMEAEPQAEK